MMPGLDPDVMIALAYVKPRFSRIFSAIFRLDHALGRVVAATREPMVGQVRLAWWRDNLLLFQQGKPVAAEPVLQALADGLDGVMLHQNLSTMVEGWDILFESMPLSRDQLATYARLRGGTLFGALAALAGLSDTESAAAVGARWALADFARHCTDAPTAADAIAMVNDRPAPVVDVLSLAILGRFATRDCARGLAGFGTPGSPKRMAWALSHALFKR